jgi:hypothetical protein
MGVCLPLLIHTFTEMEFSNEFLAFNQKTKPNLSKFKVKQTLPSEDELKRQIEQLIKEVYQGSKELLLESL